MIEITSFNFEHILYLFVDWATNIPLTLNSVVTKRPFPDYMNYALNRRHCLYSEHFTNSSLLKVKFKSTSFRYKPFLNPIDIFVAFEHIAVAKMINITLFHNISFI